MSAPAVSLGLTGGTAKRSFARVRAHVSRMEAALSPWKNAGPLPAIRCTPRVPSIAIVALLILMSVSCPLVAYAQLNALAPTFTNLNGAAVWGSLGSSTRESETGDDRPLLRLGFAAFYGPFGGRSDTVVTFTLTVSDSSDTTFCDASTSQRVHRRTRATRQHRADTKHQSDGKVTLVVGYQHATSYRFGTPLFPESVPVGGIFIASLLGPYPVPLAPRRLAWYAGIGGTVVRLSNIATRADTVAAELTTERTFAPEALFTLMYTVAPGYRVLLGASYQYLRFGSVTYRAVQAGERIPATIHATLPQELELQSVHFSLGFSFSANGLIPGR